MCCGCTVLFSGSDPSGCRNHYNTTAVTSPFWVRKRGRVSSQFYLHAVLRTHKASMATTGRVFRKKQLEPPGSGPLPKTIPLLTRANFRYNEDDNRVEEMTEGTDTNSSKLKLVPTAVEILKSIRKAIAVVAICGLTRTGKSYFLSRLIGDSNAFQLGHTWDGCTHGIWMSTTVLECEEFVVLLLDTEGIGAVSATGADDTSVFILTILLSSYLIYNSLHLPTRDDLEKMRCVQYYAMNYIHVDLCRSVSVK